MEFELNTIGREITGSGKIKKFRNKGLVPGVVYGHGERSRLVLVQYNDLEKLLKILEHDVVIVKLKIDSSWKKKCILKSIQVDPLTDMPTHVDFQILKKEEITMKVPVVLKGDAIGIKSGGILDHHMRELTIKVLPDRIPEHIEIDVSKLEVGHSIHISDLEVADYKFQDPPDTPVVSVFIPRKIEVVEAAPVVEEVTAEAEAAEKQEGEGEEVEEGKEEAREESKS